jgi:hypothetical protein
MPKPQTGSYFCPANTDTAILTMSTLFIKYTVELQPENPPDVVAKVVFRQSDPPYYYERDLVYGSTVEFLTYGLVFRVFIRAFARGVGVNLT